MTSTSTSTTRPKWPPPDGWLLPYDGKGWPPLGIDTPVQPGPWAREHTAIVDGPGGVVRFGVEGRIAGADGGVCIHVFDANLDEHLRFDCFRIAPHYHYVVPGKSNLVVRYDETASGPMLDWTVAVLRTRLPDLLALTGADELLAAIYGLDLGGVIDRVETLARAETGPAPSGPVPSGAAQSEDHAQP